VPSTECRKGKNENPVLKVLANGEHRFKEGPPGKHQLGNFTVWLGTSPAFTPAATRCVEGRTETLLLELPNELGRLPGELMSDNQTAPISAGEVLAHEIGHSACPPTEVQSNAESLEMENWFRLVREGSSSIRIFHDFQGTQLGR
jgi:hypothetical protein